jgi:hypothetical protein
MKAPRFEQLIEDMNRLTAGFACLVLGLVFSLIWWIILG